MHYVICYDLESDRNREKVVKMLHRHGCERVQKSVFVANDMSRREVGVLRGQLARLLSRMGSDDSVLILPLPDAEVKGILVLGNNNIVTKLAPLPVKITL